MRNPVRAALDAAPVYVTTDPEPLVAPNEAPRAYPLDALPPAMRKAVAAYQQYGQQPVPLVASSAIGALSLCAQGLVDVARDSHLVGPVSVNLLVVASSGERKTSADRQMCAAPRRWQRERREALATEAAMAQARVQAHAAEREGVIAKIKAAAGKKADGNAADVEALRHQLEQLNANAPHELLLPNLFHEDVTPEALAQSVAEGWPSSSLWSDEAGLVIGGHGMRDETAMRYLGLLNRMWDGTPFERKRTTAQSFLINGRRFTVSLMLQQAVLARLLAVGGGISRGIGFLARFLMACPVSTMGARLYATDFDTSALAPYDRRLRDLLDMPLPASGDNMELSPTVLTLCAAARREWIAYHDDVERSIGQFREFDDVSDFAAKSAENAARLAGLFHVFEHGPGGEIDARTILAGIQVAGWHLSEAQRLIGAMAVPQALADARLLLDWLARGGHQSITARDILRLGPAPLRDKRRRDAALGLLVETRNVLEVKAGGATTLVPHSKLVSQ